MLRTSAGRASLLSERNRLRYSTYASMMLRGRGSMQARGMLPMTHATFQSMLRSMPRVNTSAVMCTSSKYGTAERRPGARRISSTNLFEARMIDGCAFSSELRRVTRKAGCNSPVLRSYASMAALERSVHGSSLCTADASGCFEARNELKSERRCVGM